MPGDTALQRTLDAIEADLGAIETALGELEAEVTTVDLDDLEGDIEPGRLAEHLARQRAQAALDAATTLDTGATLETGAASQPDTVLPG